MTNSNTKEDPTNNIKIGISNKINQQESTHLLEIELEKTEIWKLETFIEKQEKKTFEFDLSLPFQDNFLKNDHDNYVLNHPEKGYLVVSVMEIVKDKEKYYKILEHSQTGIRIKEISKSDIGNSFMRGLFCMGPSISNIFKKVEPSYKDTSITFCDPGIYEVDNDLIEMENAMHVKTYKFGVLYAKEGQITETDILSNETGSPAFDDFLNLIGEKIELKGFKGYRGGLDIKSGGSGKHSFFSKWKNFEIMFHVATLLPTNDPKKDPQQIDKKRHIGNDVVVIIFLDGDVKYNPETMASKQNHIFIAVRPIKSNNSGKTNYLFDVCRKNEIEQFEPMLPTPPIVTNENLKDTLLSKACSGERSTIMSGSFGERFKRYRKNILEKIYEEYEN
ncbi:gtpase-activating rap/ran-gap domain-like protein [Anaeramoeba ignava]|uniref:Gtpase-activating rap/ran-gap domain-like protein n=1 Tax=Anaeramoeba ignava TaxID=1746090 RepID=A0A9Q0LV04_ANAIG|nr:gtpase-activating rap/ran-gap domain-like protein [Anaeramoeba ignava]